MNSTVLTSLQPLAHVDLPAVVSAWKVNLTEVVEIGPLSGILSLDERARAARFLFERDRHRFAICRTALRMVLGQCLAEAPERLVFRYGDHGKPELDAAWSERGIDFNVAHSGEWGLIAVAQGRRIGIDIEQVRAGVAGPQIARRYFSPAEVAELESLPEEWQEEAFFRCWTRKEAYLKAVGCGIAGGLHSFQVSLSPREPPALVADINDAAASARWQMADVLLPAGYLGALVVETAAVGGGNPPSRELETV